MLLDFNKIKRFRQLVLVFVFAVFLFSFHNTFAFAAEDVNQKILDFRRQIEELTKQAEQYKGTVVQKHKQADTLKRQIDILNGQIAQLQLRINITDRQISSAKLQINDLEGRIFDATEEIGKKKQIVGELLSLAYERDKLSLLAVLLKSSRLSDFTNQAHQADNLNNKLVSLLTELKEQKESLENQKQQLDAKKIELETLNSKQINQKSALNGNKSSKDNLLIETRGQEARYQQLLNETEKKKAQFFDELRKFEAEALKTGAFIVHVTASSIPLRGSKIFVWPYDDYYLSQGYGMTSYARSRNKPYGGAPHNGIDIVAGSGSPIKPIGGGTILASGFNNGFGNWVAVKHENNMVSVYAHMRSPSGLANGTPVAANSIIGYEGSTGNSTGSHLHLSLYRDFFTFINNKNGQLYFNYFDGSLNPIDYL